MIVLILACTPATTEVPPVPSPLTPPSVDTADTGLVERPLLRSPAEAVDSDPDPSVLHVQLTAAPHTWTIDGVQIDGLAYNGQVPGPTLRASIGDTLVVELTNELDQPTTIHWHGPTVPYAMDGAGWQITPVAAGEAFTYSFELLEAGTFWYHPHFNTDEQVDRGLYGVLIVEDPADPPVDDELVLVFDSVREVAASDANPAVDPSPTWWSVNGRREPIWQATAGERVRVRAVNVSNAGYLQLDGRVVATDQGLLAAELPSTVLSPGDRADVEVLVGSSVQGWSTPRLTHSGEVPQTLPLFDMQPEGFAPPPPAATWAFDGALPTPDPGRTDLRYTFTGSASAGWEINGQTWPDIVPDEVSLGDEVILEIRNLSPARHPFHLHGMAFEVLSVDGVAPTHRTVEDTWDIGVRQLVRVRIEADNPGDWMSHCHILPHADAGMMTVLRVQ